MIPDTRVGPAAALDQGSRPNPLQDACRAALLAPDPAAGLELVAETAGGAGALGELYVEVMRPAFLTLDSEELAPRVQVGAAALARLARRFPSGVPSGTGRSAVLSCRDDGIEAIDGGVATAFLEADGWTVERTPAPTPPLPGTVGAPLASTELVVVVTAGPEDAQRLAAVFRAFHRLPDPPVVLLCDFSGRSRQLPASTTLGLDAVAHDPAGLVRCATDRLPAAGRRRWGVRLSRSSGALRLAPTGRLDPPSVDRLVDIVLTRRGRFSRLVLDLGDLAEVDTAGILELAAWPELLPAGDVELVLLAPPHLRPQVAASRLPDTWCVTEELRA